LIVGQAFLPAGKRERLPYKIRNLLGTVCNATADANYFDHSTIGTQA
jgi:hypothetical protein